MAISIRPESRVDQDKISKGLSRLAEEDPTFTVKTNTETDETIISGMGELHLDVIVDRLKREFGVSAKVGAPKVAYRETILGNTKEDFKYAKQTGGRGQYGHVVLEVSPANPSEGFDFINSIKGGAIPREYIPAVEKGVIAVMKKGIYAGFPVVDVKVNLVDGTYHDVDSSEFAFKMAGGECFKKAFNRCEPVLLEPSMSVEITTPEDYVGGVVGDICSRRGKVINIDSKGKQQLISAEAPLAEMFGYASALRSLSSGRANYSMHFEKYVQVPFQIAESIIEEKKKEKEAKK
jgi:elongation factor G